MTSRDFCFWLQGWLEICGAGVDGQTTRVTVTMAQLDCIQRHLALVFKHEIDPSLDLSVKHKNALDKLHQGLEAVGGPLIRC